MKDITKEQRALCIVVFIIIAIWGPVAYPIYWEYTRRGRPDELHDPATIPAHFTIETDREPCVVKAGSKWYITFKP